MEIVLKKSNLREAAPSIENEYFEPGGILNSNYKNAARSGKDRINCVSAIRNKSLVTAGSTSVVVTTIIRITVFLTAFSFVLA